MVRLILFTPFFHDVGCKCIVHPHIANTQRNTGCTEVKVHIVLGNNIEDPRKDAKEVENLVPVTDSLSTVAPLLSVHRVFEDDRGPSVAVELWLTVCGFEDEVADHGRDFKG